ncbi:hypothetical protein FHX09_003422 [Rhizobium sp. BK538]|nr:hypothetical protein [Rhizobium sp. BK538]
MGATNRFVCLKGAWCTATHDSGYVLTIVENPVYFGAACDTADIVSSDGMPVGRTAIHRRNLAPLGHR